MGDIENCVLKMNLHCDKSCIQKLKELLLTLGVAYVDVERDKGLVTVYGSNLNPQRLVKEIKANGRTAEILSYTKNMNMNTDSSNPYQQYWNYMNWQHGLQNQGCDHHLNGYSAPNPTASASHCSHPKPSEAPKPQPEAKKKQKSGLFSKRGYPAESVLSAGFKLAPVPKPAPAAATAAKPAAPAASTCPLSAVSPTYFQLPMAPTYAQLPAPPAYNHSGAPPPYGYNGQLAPPPAYSYEHYYRSE